MYHVKTRTHKRWKNTPHTPRVMPWNACLREPAPGVMCAQQKQDLFRLQHVHSPSCSQCCCRGSSRFRPFQNFKILRPECHAHLLLPRRTHSHRRPQCMSTIVGPNTTSTTAAAWTLRRSCWQSVNHFVCYHVEENEWEKSSARVTEGNCAQPIGASTIGSMLCEMVRCVKFAHPFLPQEIFNSATREHVLHFAKCAFCNSCISMAKPTLVVE